MAGRRLVVAICSAELLTMAGVFAFPALLPTFVAQWHLSKTEAGWISGLYFAAFALAAPPALALTDRIDARFVYVAGALGAALSAAGFALLASGFWSALALRTLAGAALGATYLPGLRMLIDRYRGDRASRAIAFYTSCFSLGTALSFFFAGEVAAAFGWRAAFAATAGAAAAAAFIPFGLSAHTPPRPETPARLLDFRPVFANRAALGYVLAYGVHCWELFALRSWLVAFLAFALASADPPAGLSPTIVATLGGFVAMAASFGGNELCVRWGRTRVIGVVMLASAVAAAGFGFSAGLGYAAVAALSLLYTVIVQLDSASLTAGAVAAAGQGRQGATLAVHAFTGFGCAGIGPLVFGVVLDAAGGGRTTLAWGFAFVSVAVVACLGPLALRLARGQP